MGSLEVTRKMDHCSIAIIGGGIAGLTLANILERAGVSYVLWEAASSIAPAVGASIGLLPSGLRILDQIGALGAIEKSTVPLGKWEHRDAQGKLISKIHAYDHYRREIGYDARFLERSAFLQFLFDNLNDKTSVFCSKKLVNVQDHVQYNVITAADGSTMKCDIVAGADGVHSLVRREIDLACGLTQERRLDPNYLSTSFSCVYGISTAVPQMSPGEAIAVYRKEDTFLLFTDSTGQIFWFVLHDLGRSVPFECTSHYTAEDADASCRAVSDIFVKDDVSFADIYAKSTAFKMVALEEGVTENWFAGRMVLLGDSAHKMVPHGALGGNMAIESAACLANQLLALRDNESDDFLTRTSASELHEALSCYAKDRAQCAKAAVATAAGICRAQMLQGPAAEAFVEKVLPAMDDQAWLTKGLMGQSMGQKIEIDGWRWGSERVDFYSRRAKEIRTMCGLQKAVGQENGIEISNNTLLQI